MKKGFITRLRKPHLFKRMGEKVSSYFFIKQWILLTAKGLKNDPPSWSNFTPLAPPSDRIWADPFIWMQEGNYFIFYEERFYSSRRGHIACLTLDQNMNPIDNCVVLKRPYHLSYPFMFEYQQQIYMIPETEQNHAVELYRCTHFPEQWEFVKPLLTNIKAVDGTLLEAYGKWWLFTTVRVGRFPWDNLYLFYADHPLADRWTPHPRNPIVKDIRFARPAGRVFLRNGDLIRPSQDCSVRYGHAINFNRICVLTESDYAEVCEGSLKPPASGNILATHTWNQSGDLTTIDALLHKPKYQA